MSVVAAMKYDGNRKGAYIPIITDLTLNHIHRLQRLARQNNDTIELRNGLQVAPDGTLSTNKAIADSYEELDGLLRRIGIIRK